MDKVIRVEIKQSLYFHTGDWDLNNPDITYYFENGKLNIGFYDSNKEIIKPYHISIEEEDFEKMNEEDGGYIKPK